MYTILVVNQILVGDSVAGFANVIDVFTNGDISFGSSNVFEKILD